MGKTYKKHFEQYYRHPRGRKNAIINRARAGAIPPDSWDDIKLDRLIWLPYFISKKLCEKGVDRQTAERKICKKFNIPKWQALNIVHEAYSDEIFNTIREEGIVCWHRHTGMLMEKMIRK